MKLAILSDTHTFHEAIKIPAGVDTVIHCGDSTNVGKEREFRDFLNWFSRLPIKNKICIAGNHELEIYNKGITAKIASDYPNVTYLQESEIVIDGIKFWGSPHTPAFFDWAWMYQRELGALIWKYIPLDTDVLITHGPPAGILDKVTPFGEYTLDRAGCADLLEKVKEVKPILHCFGHIHSAGHFRGEDTLFINAATCNQRYVPVNKPYVVEVNVEKSEALLLPS